MAKMIEKIKEYSTKNTKSKILIAHYIIKNIHKNDMCRKDYLSYELYNLFDLKKSKYYQILNKEKCILSENIFDKIINCKLVTDCILAEAFSLTKKEILRLKIANMLEICSMFFGMLHISFCSMNLLAKFTKTENVIINMFTYISGGIFLFIVVTFSILMIQYFINEKQSYIKV